MHKFSEIFVLLYSLNGDFNIEKKLYYCLELYLVEKCSSTMSWFTWLLRRCDTDFERFDFNMNFFYGLALQQSPLSAHVYLFFNDALLTSLTYIGVTASIS